MFPLEVNKNEEEGAASTMDGESLLCRPPRDRFFTRKAFVARFSNTSVIAHAHRNVSSSGGKIDQAGYLMCFRCTVREIVNEVIETIIRRS
jgi:hypothetical protein